MTTIKTELLTAEDLLLLSSEGVRGELIRGVLHETMPAGQLHGWIVMKLGALLMNFIQPRALGTLVGSDSGVWLERDPDTVREPDIAFTSVERLPINADIDGYSEVVPDLVVEIVSPNDRPGEVAEKTAMWLSFGVRLVWLVRPDSRTIEVHRSPGEVVTLGEGDALDGFDVLPGFSCDLRAIFDD